MFICIWELGIFFRGNLTNPSEIDGDFTLLMKETCLIHSSVYSYVVATVEYFWVWRPWVHYWFLITWVLLHQSKDLLRSYNFYMQLSLISYSLVVCSLAYFFGCFLSCFLSWLLLKWTTSIYRWCWKNLDRYILLSSRIFLRIFF